MTLQYIAISVRLQAFTVAFSLIPIIFGYKLGIKSSSIRPFGHPDMSGQEKSH